MEIESYLKHLSNLAEIGNIQTTVDCYKELSSSEQQLMLKCFPLDISIEKNDVDAVQFVLELSKGKRSIEPEHTFYIIGKNNCLEVLEYLVHEGYVNEGNVNSENHALYYYAMINGHTGIMDFLKEKFPKYVSDYNALDRKKQTKDAYKLFVRFTHPFTCWMKMSHPVSYVLDVAWITAYGIAIGQLI